MKASIVFFPNKLKKNQETERNTEMKGFEPMSQWQFNSLLMIIM